MTSDELTEKVKRSVGGDNARLQEVLLHGISALHTFIKSARLTRDELDIGLTFLNRVAAANSPTHNESMLLADVLGASSLICDMQPGEDEALLGPFWRQNAPITPNGGSIVRSSTPGAPLDVAGEVIDSTGAPVSGAEVHVWQASPVGLYENQDDGQVDMNLRARVVTDSDGRFWFTSVMPAGYPVPVHGPVGELLAALNRHPYRPAHMHFIVHKDGFKPLITQLFVANDPYLESDAVFGVRPGLIGDFAAKSPASPDAGFELRRKFTLLEGPSTLPTPPIA